MSRHFLLSLSFIFISTFDQYGQGTNLVPNHSFEQLRGCPSQIGQLKLATPWQSFGTSDPSPDLFSSCAFGGALGVPNNLFGHQLAKDGSNYAGFIAYLSSKSGKSWKLKSNHREFLVVRLNQALIKGQLYHIQFAISLAENCEFGVSSLGMLLSASIPSFDPFAMELGYFKPQLLSSQLHPMVNFSDWVVITDTIQADGGERFVSIGNFTDDKLLAIERRKEGKNVFFDGMDIPKKLRPMIAYYFLDEVQVIPININSSLDTPITISEQKIDNDHFGQITKGESVKLNNIFFHFDRSELLPASYEELDALVDFLIGNLNLDIVIKGHTDNIGAKDYNLSLSADRALAVANYLIENGIEKSRITTFGKGSTEPVVANDSDQNRAINRRVEFIITDPKN